MKFGADEQLCDTSKIAVLTEALHSEGVPTAPILRAVGLTPQSLYSPQTRVSMNQILEVHRYACRNAPDPHFAFRAGLRYHATAYGAYGFAILSSTDFRQAIRFALEYHQLASPLVEVAFEEAGRDAAWTLWVARDLRIDAALASFLIEMQVGIHLSLHRDAMGPHFSPREIEFAHAPRASPGTYVPLYPCPVHFGRPRNRFIFDASWLDKEPPQGNKLTYAAVLAWCDVHLRQAVLNTGVSGRVRRILLANLFRPLKLESVASQLNLSARTLRRKLAEHRTSFRAIEDELRREVAVRLLDETVLTHEEIAESLGYSNAANFRHAFRRWTGKSPGRFRHSGS